ncbi:hypothetical protein TNCV_903421 [Trichonephila clavipes]|nr:hypothetical protein TNCV_903421 [Trichonephila clavipes]
MLIYELPGSSPKCRAQTNMIRKSFEPYDQMLYHRTILEPHTPYLILAGTNYIVLTLTPSIPAHVVAEKRPLEEKSLPFSKRRMCITPVMRRVSRRPELAELKQIPSVQIPEPVHIAEPVQIQESYVKEPVKITESHVKELVQIPDLHVSEALVLEPIVEIPQETIQELDTLEQTLTDAASLDQLMLFIFGEAPQPIPKNSSCFTRYHSFLMVISSHSWMNLKRSWCLWT